MSNATNGRRLAIMTPPKTMDEANERLAYVEAQIEMIESSLMSPPVLDSLGNKMTLEQTESWRIRAKGAINYYIKEKNVVVAWQRQYQKDVESEEREERRALHKKMIELGKQKREEAGLRHQKKLLLEAQTVVPEDIDPNDTQALLRAAWKLLKILLAEKRVTYSASEFALLDLVQDHILSTRNEYE